MRYLELLARRDPELPVHFMSGDQSDPEDQDQFALSATELEKATQSRTKKLKNVTSHQAKGGHLDSDLDSERIKVPKEHLDDENKKYLEDLLDFGRKRNQRS